MKTLQFHIIIIALAILDQRILTKLSKIAEHIEWVLSNFSLFMFDFLLYVINMDQEVS